MLKQWLAQKNIDNTTPNIFKKMFFGFIIVPIIPIVSLVYLTSNAQIEREQAVNKNLIGSAELIGANIDKWIDKNVYVSSLISQTDAAISMDPSRQKPLLLNIKENSTTITAVRIDDATGQSITRSDDKPLKNYADRQYFQQIKSGDTIGQQVIFGRTQQKPLLCFSVPIKSNGDFLGGLSQCSTLDSISNGVTDLNIGETGYAFLVDSANQLIAHGGDNDVLSGALEDMSTHPALTSNEIQKVFSYVDEGRDVIAYKETVGLDWTLIVQQDYNEAFAAPIQARNQTIIAIVLTALACFFIIFFMSRIISQPLQQARKETDNILGAASDGLFLIDKDYVIGQQQSSNLEEILQQTELSGKSFMRYLDKSVTLNVAQMAKDYIDLLFSERIKESLVQSRNPLKLVQTSIENNEGKVESKYLNLTFKRVYSAGKISNLFVTAKDITTEIKLQRELDKTKEEKDEQINLLTDILYIPHSDLLHFLDETNETLNKINTVLERSGSGNSFYQKKIGSIYKLIHKIKGDASAINFELFASECHEFEELLSGIQNKGQLTGNEFLPVALALEELFKKRYMIDELFQKLKSFVKNNGDEGATNDTIPDYLKNWYPIKNLADNLASQYKKNVEVHFRGFKTPLPNDYQSAMKDIAIQLVRNSLVHGIEDTSDRQKTTKLQDGQITMSLKHSHGIGYIFTYMDDGKGIDYFAIREKIVRHGIASEIEAQGYTEKQLLKIIFSNGFSIKEDADLNAGRGVGLSLVASRIKELGGRIQVSSVFGKNTMFKIVFPSKSSMAA